MLSFLSYRTDPHGGDVAQPSPQARSVLTKSSSLTLLIHGYNCQQEDAQQAYINFIARENAIAPVSANAVGIFWPGDNWEGPVYYMQSVAHVKKTAILLAQDIYEAARAWPYFKIDVVAHSMGNRLVLETMNNLLALIADAKNAGDRTADGLVINRIVFMAGAVPTEYVEPGQHLRTAIEVFNGTMSLYSKKDWVLHYFFPLGESVLAEGFFPVALGRKQWGDGTSLPQRMIQNENPGATHSDYWGADSKKDTCLQTAANYVSGFLSLGGTPPRVVAGRAVAGKSDAVTRATVSGRSVVAYNGST